VRNLKLVIEYDGTSYAGWQRQTNSRTIQGEVERVLAEILQETVSVTGAGRTDAGVHALAQVANFRTGTTRPTREIRKGLNGLLPSDIVVHDVSDVHLDFHARYDATERRYSYLILRTPSALMRNFAWHVGYDLDVNLMRRAAGMLVGTHEFGSFCKNQHEVPDVRCTIAQATWYEDGDRLVFKIHGDRFLHGMVRSLVGTMVDVGRGYTRLDVFMQLLEKNDRRDAGMSAPARGLTLEEIMY
jgi:tRNA pseudouridine38-40 synthase